MADSLLLIVGLLLGAVLGYIVGHRFGYDAGWADAMLERGMRDLYRDIEGREE